MRSIVVFVALALSNQAASAQQSADALKRLNGQTLMYVANGSGQEATLSTNLIDAAKQAHALVFVKTICWSRFGDMARDHLDQEGQLIAAAQAAQEIQLVRQHCPQSRVILIGHSTGCHVLLAAAGQLPERSVERLILLAPSVSAYYDVRPALQATRLGIDLYYSANDTALSIASSSVGTADGQWTPCAGEVGFQVPRDPQLAKQFQGLRQHAWNDRMQNLQNFGGHFSWTRTRFLRDQLMPCLMLDEMPVRTTKK